MADVWMSSYPTADDSNVTGVVTPSWVCGHPGRDAYGVQTAPASLWGGLEMAVSEVQVPSLVLGSGIHHPWTLECS